MLNPNLEMLRDVETPALIVDEAAVARNIAAMADFAKANRIALRPHGKTHKSAQVARLQMGAGAVGLACATVAEIEAFARAGIPGLLLTAPVVDRPKLERLTRIMRDTALGAVVDHVDQLQALSELAQGNPRPIEILIDVDVGQKRTGVCDPAASVEIARRIMADPAFRFGGVQGFAGQVQHIISADERQAAAIEGGSILNRHIEALRQAGIACPTVSGSGTGAAGFDLRGPYTELQVGSYVFMDADYGKLKARNGGALPYERSLFILATVTSVNRENEFTVDAGVKALAFNGPTPSRIAGVPAGSSYRFAGDEHGVIGVPAGSGIPRLGSRVLMEVTHCDPTVNLHAEYVVITRNAELERWPILARYGS